MTKPLLYDLYCGAGGATKGYQQAGFRVIGVDLVASPRYCGDGFIQMDALEFLRRYIAGEFERAQAFAASPPCQGYSIMNNLPWLKSKQREYLILPTRELLKQTGLPYALENVMGARYGAKGLKLRATAGRSWPGWKWRASTAASPALPTGSSAANQG